VVTVQGISGNINQSPFFAHPQLIRDTVMTYNEHSLAAIHDTPRDRGPVFPLLMFFAAYRTGLTYREGFARNGNQ